MFLVVVVHIIIFWLYVLKSRPSKRFHMLRSRIHFFRISTWMISKVWTSALLLFVECRARFVYTHTFLPLFLHCLCLLFFPAYVAMTHRSNSRRFSLSRYVNDIVTLHPPSRPAPMSRSRRLACVRTWREARTTIDALSETISSFLYRRRRTRMPRPRHDRCA